MSRPSPVVGVEEWVSTNPDQDETAVHVVKILLIWNSQIQEVGSGDSPSLLVL